MKRIIYIMITILLLTMLFLIYKYINKNNVLNENDAIKIAENDVSNKSGNYYVTKIEHVNSNDDNFYYIIFNDEINDYEYKIDIKTKKILYSSKSLINNDKIYLDEDKIVNIVLNHLNASKEKSTILLNEVIIEDQNAYYKTIVYYQSIRYEYHLNAYTGSIISIVKIDENEQ